MRSPFRTAKRLLQAIRLRERVMTARTRLSLELQKSVRLERTTNGGGQDLILSAFDADRVAAKNPIASVRIIDHKRRPIPDEPQLPRQLLSPLDRLQTEVAAYQLLSPAAVCPGIICYENHFIASHWIQGQRLSDSLRTRSDSLWEYLPACLRAIRCMHNHNIVHMDLNCGNFLIPWPMDENSATESSGAVIIDFEFAPAPELQSPQQRGFDYLRFAHSLLKPRRGLEAVVKNPGHFVSLFEEAVSGLSVSVEGLPEYCYLRLKEFPMITTGLRRVLTTP
ncbi:MAG: hypothetical protein R3C20_14535 [Planctomycetaceae bacterium]